MAIELTLETASGTSGQTNTVATVAEIERQAVKLTPEEQAQVDDFAKAIDIHNSVAIGRYGERAQNKSSSFSDKVLEGVRAKDAEEVGDMLTELVVQLSNFKPGEEPKGLMGFFQKAGNRLAAMQSQYDTVAGNIDKTVDTLTGHRLVLTKDIKVLDDLFADNLEYYKELTMYILAGEQRLQEVQTTELANLRARAVESGLQEDAQAANDLAEQCNRFEKRLYDLKLTRTICIQMAPQIRMVQSVNMTLADKIQSSTSNTIPIWKNQMILALGLSHTKKAIEAQRAVTDITNRLLRENADMLKTATVDAARESERSIVDIETLMYTNEQLISSFEEISKIENDGREKRQHAVGELRDIEDRLKNKMLEMRGDNN